MVTQHIILNYLLILASLSILILRDRRTPTPLQPDRTRRSTMLVSLNSTTIQSIVDKTCSTLKQDLVDLGVSSMTPVVDYNSIPSSMSIDDYLEKPDEFYDSVSSLYQELVTTLQQQAEADASPRAYWDLAEKLMLRAVADAISSTQDDMRSESNDSTFKSEPRQ